MHRAGPADWRHVAPVTIVQTSPMTTVDMAFEGRLATRRSPLFVEPLGHELTPDGPSGHTAAEVVPGPPRHFGAPAVQRQTASFATPASDVDADDALDDATSTASAAPSPTERVGEIVTDSVPAPLQVRPTVAAEHLATSLVRAADDHVAPITFAATPPAPTPHPPVVARAAAHDQDASLPVQPSITDAARPDDVPVQPVQRDAGAPSASVVGLLGGTPAAQSATATPDDPSPASRRTPPDTRPQRDRAPDAVQRAMGDTSARREHAGQPASTPPADPAVTASDALAADAPLQPAPPPSPPSSPPSTGGEPSPFTTATPRTTRGLIGPPVSRSDGAGPSPRPPSPPVQRAPQASDAGTRPPIDAHRSADTPAIAPTVDARPVPLVSGLGRASEPVVPTLPALQRARDDSGPNPPAPPPDALQASAAEPHGAPDVVDVRPTLSATWNPGLVEPVLQRFGLGRSDAARGETAGAQVVPPAGIARAVQRADDEPSPHPDDRHDLVRPDTVVPTLGAPPGPHHPGTSAATTATTATTAAPATRRAVVGPPVSRSAVQRQPIDVPARSRTGPFDDVRRPDHDADATIDVDAMPITAWPPVQRETDGQPAEAPTSGAPTVTAEATSGPAAGSDQGAAGRSDAEIQELLRTLYPPLRRRLCRDLLLDRERAGYATDIRF